MKDLKGTLMALNLASATVADQLREKRIAPKIVQEAAAVLHAQLVAVMECSTLLIRIIEGAEEEVCGEEEK